ncbi:MAG: leucine-rich repeat protein, partial [Paludibacteraceae bacterium]|nr:leucine-rich repeat protein [Paludibacteraceae bacterium]
MRKILTFLCAALMSVGMFAKVTPQGTDVWDETTKTLTVNGNPVSYAYSGVSDIENLVISDAVTSIGDDAFYNCIGLKSVSFSSSLTSLGEEAFANCSKLESVTLPASLESIGKSAFYTCGNLTEVTIPDGVTSIGQQAFYFCEKLTSVTIPNSVASIGGQAFLRCGGLTGIVVAAENPNYCSENGVLFNKDKTTLIQYPGGKQGEYTIPNSVTSIGNLAFSMCSLLTSVEIPNSVVEIVDYAFQSCSGLTSVNIGNGVTSIGKYAFYYCSNLASVTIHATTQPTLGSKAFDKTAAALKIYVPEASVADYKSNWTAYADKIEAIPGGDEPAKYYLVGDMNGWNEDDAYLLTLNEAAEGVEYMITLDLKTTNQFKVKSGDIWYPDGVNNNYGQNGEIAADGNYTIYFRPNGDGGDDWFSHVLYVAKNESASAEKTIVVFEANGNRKEVEVEALPHTFSCSYSNKNGELDAIIKELYEISAGHCSDDNYPVASGNEAVLAGSNGFDNYITIS